MKKLKGLLKEMADRFAFMLELWAYDKQKRSEDLWVTLEEE